jgi:superfamily II DNA/RNA helicase
VWTDNLSPNIFTLITQLPANEAQTLLFFETQMELVKTIKKQFKEAYLISDFSKTTEEMRAKLCNYYMEYVPKLVKAKVSYIAFVCPHQAFEQLPADKKAKLSEAPLGIYPTFVEALSAVNLKRSLELSQRFENSLR